MNLATQRIVGKVLKESAICFIGEDFINLITVIDRTTYGDDAALRLDHTPHAIEAVDSQLPHLALLLHLIAKTVEGRDNRAAIGVCFCGDV